MKTLLRFWQPIALAVLSVATFAGLGWTLFFRGDDSSPFMPHEHCYLWNPGLVWLHGISDFLIGASYVAISTTLTYLVLRARREIPFHWMMLAFATFIVACGATHFMEVWTLRTLNPPYWFAGNLKLVTAFASLATACLLPPLVPKIRHLLEQARLSSERQVALATAHELLEQAHARVQQLDQLKTNFFANISHELRTPVTLIVGPVDHLLADVSLNRAARHELEIVRRNALLLHKHVNDLLEISRIEAGRLQLQYSKADLTQMVRLVSSYFGSSSARPLVITVDCPETLVAEVDAEKIERVLLNLISNAFKFTPEGGSVHVVAKLEGETVIIAVTDTGPGVPAELREAIFERFHQGINPTSRGGAGTGLGLAIVKEFVTHHGGSVVVSERAGGGAVFTVQLPRRAPEGAEVHDEKVATLSPLYRGGMATVESPVEGDALDEGGKNGKDEDRPLIVLAEDNPDMGDHIRRTLGSGYRVRLTRDGMAALRAAQEEPPDLILSDLMMPEMDGVALLEAVRREPALANVPVMLLTARADDDLRLRLLRQGAQDYLLKPFGGEELRARVSNLIATKRVRDTLQHELSTQERDVARLALEVTARARELERAREQAEQASQAKDRFIAVLSHELRTPLTPVLATALSLEANPEVSREELLDSLRLIRRNVELEARLIDDLLDLTRIVHGKLHLELVDTDAHQAIRHAVDMCQAEIARKPVKFSLELNARRFHLHADASRVLQIAWNLLQNAVKFTPAEGRITVSTANRGDGRFVLTVTDSGMGMEPETLARLFTHFEQGERSVTRRFGGLGLGLAVAKGLVVAQGGTLSAESAGIGLGSTFTVEFPCLADGASVAPILDLALPPPPVPRSLHILLVEDHADTRESISRLLRRWGHTVQTAGTVAEAHALLGTDGFEVLLSDLGLPDGHGTEIMQSVRRGGMGLLGIAMSGFGTEEDVARSHEVGFLAHLTKPVAAQRLQATLQQAAELLHTS